MTTFAFPLSFAQERFWLIQQLAPESPTFNIAMGLRLRGRLDEDALRASIVETVERHESLRTTFPVMDGEPRQIVSDIASLEVPRLDLHVADTHELDAELGRLLDGERSTPFDLAQGPLFRAKLVRCGVHDHLLVLSVHHIVCDGWSLDVLTREIAALYAAKASGASSSLATPAIQYPDYAVWQRDRAAEGAYELQLAYWRAKLDGAPSSELVPDRPRSSGQSVTGARHEFAVPPETFERLRAAGLADHATTFMVVVGAFDMLLARLIGSDEIVVGTSVAGRTRPELDSLIGCFLNTVVLRTDLSGNPSFREVLRRVRETTLEALEHQDVPFERVVASLDAPRDLRRNPFFQIMVVHQNVPVSESAFPGLDVEFLPSWNGTAKLDLTLDTAEQDGGLACTIEYLTELFDAETIERLAGQLVMVFEAVAANPDVRVSELRLLPKSEEEMVLAFSGGPSVPGADAMVPHLIAVQAERAPTATAVFAADGELTYAELWARAQATAVLLREAGVRTEDPVAVAVQRGLNLSVGLLGVLLAGGAVLPLETSAGSDAGAAARVLGARFVVLDSDAPGQPGDVRVVDLRGAGDDAPDLPATAVRPEHILALGREGAGVPLTHGAAAAVVDWARRVLTDEDLAGMLAASTATPLVVLWELLLPLCWGGCVTVTPLAGDLAHVAELAPATTLTIAAEQARDRVLPDVQPPWLRTLCVLSSSLSDAVTAVAAADRVVALYAPHGAPAAGACWAAGEAPELHPIDGAHVYVLDSQLTPVPRGQAGDVYVGGEVTRRARPSGPEAGGAVLASPFAAERGASLLRTGDRGRWTADGTLAPAFATDLAGTDAEQVPARSLGAAQVRIGAVLARIWRDVLDVDEVERDTNFFDLGGHSLALVRVQVAIARELTHRIQLLELFEHPTISALAAFVAEQLARPDSPEAGLQVAKASVSARTESEGDRSAIAIIGMACRVPGADGVEGFWENLLNSVDAGRELTEEELLAAGIERAEFEDPRYVRRVASIEGAVLFDAAYFGYSAREAEIIDPQQRVFLELTHDALQDAGYDPDQYDGAIGVFGGIGLNLYGWENVASNWFNLSISELQALVAIEKDHAATRAAYKLNLRGPAITLQTSCSTSLVAICTAVRALALGECDIAVAGGTNVRAQPAGYLYVEGGTLSPDGYCRAFDARARGQIPGLGAAFVVLKRLPDALAAGDEIHAVIRGVATNNDGSDKVGYTAPSVSGQARVIRAAQAAAGVDPRSIGYVEAHGTGTPLGDPIEVSALTRVFGKQTNGEAWCGLGSV
jgi:non-ribosomal peptide synthetase component F/3-oxoacyl-(acyl-carrier-protein) synthase/acyl carrier protein